MDDLKNQLPARKNYLLSLEALGKSLKDYAGQMEQLYTQVLAQYDQLEKETAQEYSANQISS